MLEHGVYNVAAPEGGRAGEHLKDRATKRIDVGARIDCAGLALLRTHVVWTATYFADICQLLAGAGIVGQFDNAKIDDLDAAAGL